tara:strand:- start:200 stop:850 length:651 start_codon:yes stop_codon:yes gene_type:complete
MFHKEGYTIILVSFFAITSIFVAIDFLNLNVVMTKVLRTVLIIILLLILQFFRNPRRHTLKNDTKIISPADGKIVIIKKVTEKEYFKKKCLQISIFMSPINVHVTRYPIGGKIVYSKYHPGKYIFAWHPKSSEKNERTTIVVENKKIGKILYRQIAGALARRIVNYAKTNETVIQGEDAGFIKFGSRIDLFLPINCKINVNLNEKVRGGESIIAEF